VNQEESEQNEVEGTKKGACTVYSGSDNAQCATAQWRSVNNNGLRTTCESDGGIHFVIVLTYETRSIASCVLSPSSQNVRAINVFTSADELLTNTRCCHPRHRTSEQPTSSHQPTSYSQTHTI